MQKEKPGVSPEVLCKTLGVELTPECKVGGGRFESFREGWAITGHAKGHYFVRCADDLSKVKSLCGVLKSARWLWGVGTFDKCSRCTSAAKKRAE